MKKKKQRNDTSQSPAPDEIESQPVREFGDAVGGGEDSSQPTDPLLVLRERVESLEDSLLRAKADYQNLQRTSARERTDACRYANTELMKSLLTALDDLERTLAAAAAASADISSVAEGIRLVHENLMKALGHHGLEVIEAAGRPFDPSIHEALMQQPSTEQAPGTVLEEVAKGYRLGERVIRPSKVVVSKAPQRGSSETGEMTKSTQPSDRSGQEQAVDGDDSFGTRQAPCESRE